MNVKLFALGVFLVVLMQKVVAMEENQLSESNQEKMDKLILLLERQYAAEETSCCGIGSWQRDTFVTGLAEKILQKALKEGLSEEHRMRIVKFIMERKVLDGEWSCNDQGQCPRLDKALSVERAIAMEAKKDK